MSLLVDERSVVLGAQHPRVCSLPGSAVSSAGREAVELARMAGLVLDPWQELVLEGALGERADGKWAAFEVGVCVSRQNGKGALLEARELAGLFLLGEKFLIHSAHQFDTSLEAFRRLLSLIESSDEFSRRVRRVSRSHGEEGIELTSGQRIRFRTRTKGGGRGFSGDLLVLDEAMMLPASSVGALMPTLSAQENPQVWYTGSAVDQLVHENGVVFSRVRARGHRGGDPSLAYFEWGVDASDPDDVSVDVMSDPAAWAAANPGMGIRITPEYVGNEFRSLDQRTFTVERLGVGDWPRTDGGRESVISPETWAALSDALSAPVDPVCFAFDVSPDRSRASIGVAGFRGDGLSHVEVVDRRHGTDWVVPRLLELVARHDYAGVGCDGNGPASSLIPELEHEGVSIVTLSAQDHARACGFLFDCVEQAVVRHRGSPELAAALKGAEKRPLGDAWAWSRKNSGVDISPLVAVTLALWLSAKPTASPWFGW